MSYERQRISQKDLQKVKMGRGYLAFVPMEFQSEVKSLSRDDWKQKEIRSNLLEIGNLLDPTKNASRDIPSRQCLWLLILNCLQFKGNYFCQKYTTSIYRRALHDTRLSDRQIHGSVLQFEEWRAIHLSIRLGGMGVRELSHVRYAKFHRWSNERHHDDGELHGNLNKLYGLFANRKTCCMALSQQRFSKNIVINIRSKNSSFST